MTRESCALSRASIRAVLHYIYTTRGPQAIYKCGPQSCVIEYPRRQIVLSQVSGIARCRWRHGFGWPHPRVCRRSCAPPLPSGRRRRVARATTESACNAGVGHLNTCPGLARARLVPFFLTYNNPYATIFGPKKQDTAPPAGRCEPHAATACSLDVCRLSTLAVYCRRPVTVCGAPRTWRAVCAKVI